MLDAPRSRPYALLAALATIPLLHGCGSSSKSGSSDGVNTSLMALGSGEADGVLIANPKLNDRPMSVEETLLANAEFIEQQYAEAIRRKKAAPAGPAPASPNASPEASTGLSSLAAPAPEAITQDPYVLGQADEAWSREAAATTPTPANPPTTVTPTAAPSSSQAADATNASKPATSSNDDKVVALAARVATLIRDRPADGSQVMPEAVALAMIESLQPGALRGLDTTGALLNARLNAEDRATLIAARDRVASTPAASSEEIRTALAQIAAPSELKIPQARLCMRVRGFGQYDAFPTNAFPAGKGSKAIVYTEIDGFTTRPARRGDPIAAGSDVSEQVSVELEQSLTLFQQDGYQVWHRPPQRVIETSRVKRRDFYLIQIIELHRSLAIGRYNLKVTLKDLNSGAVTESMIPVEVTGQ